MNKIIFLDIDGPMIPATAFILFGPSASFDRKFSPISVAIINDLLNRDKSIRIVFNSSHNINGNALINDAIREGIPADKIHPASLTKYPNYDYVGGYTRYHAIQDWILDQNQYQRVNMQWVAVDDAPIGYWEKYQFKRHDNWIEVDFDNGLTLNNYNDICKKFNIVEKLIL